MSVPMFAWIDIWPVSAPRPDIERLFAEDGVLLWPSGDLRSASRKEVLIGSWWILRDERGSFLRVNLEEARNGVKAFERVAGGLRALRLSYQAEDVGSHFANYWPERLRWDADTEESGDLYLASGDGLSSE